MTGVWQDHRKAARLTKVVGKSGRKARSRKHGVRAQVRWLARARQGTGQLCDQGIVRHRIALATSRSTHSRGRRRDPPVVYTRMGPPRRSSTTVDCNSEEVWGGRGGLAAAGTHQAALRSDEKAYCSGSEAGRRRAVRGWSRGCAAAAARGPA